MTAQQPIFRTPVNTLPQLAGTLTHTAPVVLMGSCFADNMAARLQADLYPVTANPFGTLYNPLTIEMALSRAMRLAPYDADCTVWDASQQLWHGWEWHGCMSRPNQQEALDNANAQLQQLHDALKQASLLILTFGTAYVWRHRTGRIVANCHKLPSTEFTRQRLDLKAMTSLLHGTLQRLHSFNPGLKIMLTVSPVRHIGDGLHDNNVSKSMLMLMCVELSEISSYFPSYEMLIDDLRDYRFYAEDMCHPSPLAIDYIYHRLLQACADPSEAEMLTHIRRYMAFASHRPLSASADAQAAHQAQVQQRCHSLIHRYPILANTLCDIPSKA